MTKKVYKFNRRGGKIVKVSFCSTGCYTFTDEDGNEHEVGRWWKQPMWLDVEKTVQSKDKKAAWFAACRFGSKDVMKDFRQTDLAQTIAISEVYKYAKVS